MKGADISDGWSNRRVSYGHDVSEGVADISTPDDFSTFLGFPSD